MRCFWDGRHSRRPVWHSAFKSMAVAAWPCLQGQVKAINRILNVDLQALSGQQASPDIT